VVLGVLATLVVVVVLTERLANARRPAPRDGGESAGSGMLGELVEIFQPSHAHVTAEKERQRLDIVQTPAEGAPFGVDLDAGVAYIPAPGADGPEPRTDDDGAAPGGVAPSS